MRHIILIACAVVLLMALPLGASQATLLENQVVNQVNQPTAAITGCTSAARSSPLVTLTAGREYVVVSGARSSTAGQQNSRVDFVAAGNGGSGYVTRNGTVTQHAPLQTNLVLLRHHNLTTINYDAFWFAVRMNPTSTIQLEIYTFSDTSSHSPIGPYALNSSIGLAANLTCSGGTGGRVFDVTNLTGYKLNVTAYLCDSLVKLCPDGELRGPLANTQITLSGNVSGTAVTNSTGVANFTSLVNYGVVQVDAYKSGYTNSISKLIIVPSGSSYNTSVYLKKSNLTIQPTLATFTTPNPAIHFINKTTPEVLYWGIFKLQSGTGVATLKSGPYPLHNPLETTRYPLTGPTTSQSGLSNHTGQYYIVVVNNTAAIQDYTSFVICPSGACQAQPPIPNSAVNASMSQQLLKALIPVIEPLPFAIAEEDRGYVLNTLDNIYGGAMCARTQEHCLFPNMYLLAVLATIFLLVVVAFRRRSQ